MAGLMIEKQMQIATPGDLNRACALNMLKSEDKAELVKALGQIATLGEDQIAAMDIGEAVARKMGHPDGEVVAAALRTLGYMGASAFKYTQFIVASLGHSDPSARAAAAEALGFLGPNQPNSIADALVKSASKDNEGVVRAAAVKALGDMEATDQFEVVMKLLEDTVPEVQCAAIETLGIFLSLSLEVQSCVQPEERAKALMSMLSSGRTRYSALLAIYSMGSEVAPASVAAQVVDTLVDKDALTRQAAAAAIGVLGEAVMANTAAKLKDFLKSGDAGQKAASAFSLGAIGKPAAPLAADVAELLGDASVDESWLASVIGGAARRPPPGMRKPKCAALIALARMEDKHFVGKISEALNDKDYEVRLNAAEALGMLGEAAKGESSALLGSLDDDTYAVRAMAAEALGSIGDGEAVTRLVECFDDPSFTVRSVACAAVGRLGKFAEEQCHEVFKLTLDPINSVRASACKALSQIGETGQNYASVLATMLYDESNDSEVQCAVLEALGDMGKPGANCWEEVQQFIGSPIRDVSMAAVAAFEKMGGNAPAFLKAPPLKDKDFKGLGLYYAGIQKEKDALQKSGKWVGDIF